MGLAARRIAEARIRPNVVFWPARLSSRTSAPHPCHLEPQASSLTKNLPHLRHSRESGKPVTAIARQVSHFRVDDETSAIDGGGRPKRPSQIDRSAAPRHEGRYQCGCSQRDQRAPQRSVIDITSQHTAAASRQASGRNRRIPGRARGREGEARDAGKEGRGRSAALAAIFAGSSAPTLKVVRSGHDASSPASIYSPI